jgi:hypothetical protein
MVGLGVVAEACVARGRPTQNAVRRRQSRWPCSQIADSRRCSAPSAASSWWIRLADLPAGRSLSRRHSSGSAWPISAGPAWPIPTGSALPIARGSHRPSVTVTTRRRSAGNCSAAGVSGAGCGPHEARVRAGCSLRRLLMLVEPILVVARVAEAFAAVLEDRP